MIKQQEKQTNEEHRIQRTENDHMQPLQMDKNHLDLNGIMFVQVLKSNTTSILMTPKCLPRLLPQDYDVIQQPHNPEAQELLA